MIFKHDRETFAIRATTTADFNFQSGKCGMKSDEDGWID